MPGIGVENDGGRGGFQQLRQEALHLHGAKAAVETERIHAQAFRYGNGSGDRAAGEQLALGIEREGEETGSFVCSFTASTAAFAS